MLSVDDLLLPGLLPTPDGSDLSLSVPCQRETRTMSRHEVVLHTDWSISTPHDLDAERVAAALGAHRVSCLDLLDHDVAVAQMVIQRWSRRERPALYRPFPETGWLLNEDHCSSCQGRWRHPVAAARHSRNAGHLLRNPAINASRVKALVDAVVSNYLIDVFAPPRVARSRWVSEEHGLALLWDCGFHPEMVRRIHRHVTPGGQPLPAAFYLGAISNDADLAWLKQTLREQTDARTAIWLATSYLPRDGEERGLRMNLMQLGLPNRLVEQLSGTGASADDVIDLAHRTDRTALQAADVLVRWFDSWEPVTVDDLLQLRRLGVDESVAPAARDVLQLMMDNRSIEGSYTLREKRLLLAITGDADRAAKVMQRGIHDLAAARRLAMSDGAVSGSGETICIPVVEGVV